MPPNMCFEIFAHFNIQLFTTLCTHRAIQYAIEWRSLSSPNFSV